MAPIVHSVEIDRSREDVFAYVTDPTRFPEWQEAVVGASTQGQRSAATGLEDLADAPDGEAGAHDDERADGVQPAGELSDSRTAPRPITPWRRCLAGPAGFEPATPGFGDHE